MDEYIAGRKIDINDFDVVTTIPLNLAFRIIAEASEESPVYYPVSWSDQPLVVTDPTYIEIINGDEKYPIEKSIFDKTYDIIGENRCTKKRVVTFAKRLTEPTLIKSLEDTIAHVLVTGAGNWIVLDQNGNPYAMSDKSFWARYNIIYQSPVAIESITNQVENILAKEDKTPLEVRLIESYNEYVNSNKKNMLILRGYYTLVTSES